MTFLLDTNVVSELRKEQPDRGVTDWFDSVAASQLFRKVDDVSAKGVSLLNPFADGQ